MDFESYKLDPATYDEMFLQDGAPQERWRGLHEALSGWPVWEMTGIQERVTRFFSNESISFQVYGDAEGEERIIPVDCVPRVLSGSACWASRTYSGWGAIIAAVGACAYLLACPSSR